MILGIGTDLANIERIEGTLARFGERFLARVFTPEERRKAEARADRAGTYAKRWAAKEACSKALGTGLRMGIAWRDMGVANLPTGGGTMSVMASPSTTPFTMADRRTGSMSRHESVDSAVVVVTGGAPGTRGGGTADLASLFGHRGPRA